MFKSKILKNITKIVKKKFENQKLTTKGFGL